ncbi:MAG TPA: hypothetical protein VLQ89_06340, partial [Candidatus Binatia bacterium]|nr:hypothetical protein [Candidatus Binatia bacterium]
AALFTDIAREEFAAKKVSAFWSELLLTRNKISGWLGYAFEDLNAEEQLAVNELKKTNCLLAGIQYAAGSGVSFGLEFAHFLSQHFESSKLKTNQLIFSAQLSL